VLVTSASIRPFVRSLVERFRSQTTVLSQAEIHPAPAEDRRKRLETSWPPHHRSRRTGAFRSQATVLSV